ncbi:protein kinase domain-containing protein [Paludisphaera borealis]|uniref:Serine/threonine-protein kinase PrkC n=1 Tax=Paludisphaera borealis TaxID=1387353 RepID=A0A1U7CQ75_9BACT|nr:protein kinase [Paludisphaera borealis]APW61058.1 Serine/threonine-protein kinase PrkC [Paludisphaera borealis]
MVISDGQVPDDPSSVYSATEADSGSAGPTPASPPSFGDFRIIREIGRGGMGVVYEAEQISLGRRVALKVLSHVTTSAKQRRRFEREAKAAGRLHHTHIVPVFGVGEHDGTPYYVMQFIAGVGLHGVINELRKLESPPAETAIAAVDQAHGPSMGMTVADASDLVFDHDPTTVDPASAPEPVALAVEDELNRTADDPALVAIARALLDGRSESTDAEPAAPSDSSSGSLASLIPHADVFGRAGSGCYWKRVARIGAEVARGLDYAHGQGVLHRDIKPSNLLLDERGAVWVTDFGLAKAGDQQDLTQSGDVVGTLRYMPPEAFEGVSGPCGDVYGLGLTLYELLARRPAFDEKDRARLIKQVTEADPPRLGKLDPRIPRDLATVVQKAIERAPANRYASAAEFAADLQRFLDDEPVKARRASLVERYLRWAWRNPTVAALGGLLAAVLVLATVGSLAAARRFRDQAEVQHQLAEDREAERLDAQRARDEEAEAHRLADSALTSLQSVRDVLRGTLYATRSNLAMSAWDANDFGQMHSLLDLLRPAPGEPDLRGWEWRYLQRLGNEERLTLRSPGEGFIDAAISPDGRTIASLEMDDRIRFWDRADGKLRTTINVKNRSHAELYAGVHALAYSPDGRWLAGPGHEDSLSLYDAATGALVRTIEFGRGAVLSLAWSPDGKRLAAAQSRHIVRVWNVETGKPIEPYLGGHEGPVASVDVSRDGRFAVSGGFDGAVKIWNFQGEPKLIRQLIGRGEEIRAVVFSPDGRHVASGGLDGAVRIWETESGRSVAVLRGHDAAVHCLAYCPTGLLASAGNDDTVKIWDPASGRELRTFKGHTEGVRAVAFSPDGCDLLSASTDGSIKVWDAESPPRPRSLYSPSVLTYGGVVECVALSPDGRRLATGQDDHAVRIWDVAKGRLLYLLTGHNEPIRAVAFSPDGRLLASAAGSPDQPAPGRDVVCVWEVETGRRIASYSGFDNVVDALVFIGDGHWLASAGGQSKIHIWNVDDGELRATLSGHGEDVRRLALSPDGKLLASTSSDGTAKIWELPGGALRATIDGHGERVAVAFNHDGRLLATAAADAAIQVWNVADGTLRQTLKGHLREVDALAFAPDDRLASAGLDKTIRIWDLASGQSVLSLNGHSGAVTGLAFSPDGRVLASSSRDRTVRLWEAPLQ